MDELNLGETASWIAKIKSNKFHFSITTSYSIVGTVECRKLVMERNGDDEDSAKQFFC